MCQTGLGGGGIDRVTVIKLFYCFIFSSTTFHNQNLVPSYRVGSRVRVGG